MALRLLDPNEGARNMGCMVWVEDLEKRGYTYGDLLAFLEDLHVQCVCSPIHDRDTYTAEDVRGWCKRHLDPDTGEVAEESLPLQPVMGNPKKPHVHVYFKFKGPRKPKDFAKYWADFVPEVTEKRFVLVPDWDAMVRYCAHMDAPNKAPYDPAMIHGFSNVDMSAIWESHCFNKVQVLLEINQTIKKNRIENYKRLNNWAIGTGDVDIISFVKGNHSYFCAIFAAHRQEKIDRAEKKKSS